MNIPQELLYTREHEWILVGDQGATLGITDYAQKELGDIVFVELPQVGETFQPEEAFASIESVKAVSEVYCPVSSRITQTNELLTDSPQSVNEDPYGDGWLIRIHIEERSQLKNLLSAKDYREYVEEELDH